MIGSFGFDVSDEEQYMDEPVTTFIFNSFDIWQVCIEFSQLFELDVTDRLEGTVPILDVFNHRDVQILILFMTHQHWELGQA